MSVAVRPNGEGRESAGCTPTGASDEPVSAPVGDVAPSGMLAEAPLRATHFRPEERSWGELQLEALRASEGTRARLYLLIQASQPELSDDEAWRTATRQAYDDLAARWS